jgi:hypothetical protein
LNKSEEERVLDSRRKCIVYGSRIKAIIVNLEMLRNNGGLRNALALNNKVGVILNYRFQEYIG